MKLIFDARRAEDAYRVLHSFLEVMPRLFRSHRERIERRCPEIQLVRCLGEHTLGDFSREAYQIRLAWTAFAFLDDAALQGLLAHELAHAMRHLLGIMVVPDYDEEERQTNALMASWGLRREREALDAAKEQDNLWEALHYAAAE